MKTTYQLSDDIVKVMIGLRLKGKALEWLHSKSEHIGMPIDRLFEEMRRMFWHRKNKLELRKKFESRVWRKDETFSEYLHDKMILGNRIPIDEEELIDYVIDGIPDEILRNQARIQRFEEMNALQEAFEKLALRDKSTLKTDKSIKQRGSGRTWNNSKNKEEVKTEASGKRCFNCGERDHLSNKCPSKERGVKCFECGEHGHIAAKCATKSSSKDSCAVSQSGQRKCFKKYWMEWRLRR